MKPWIIYTRVSTEEQAAEGVSLHAQRDACQALLRAGGQVSAEVIEDAGFSAKNLLRPGAQKLLRLVDEGAVAGVCVYRLDRLTRSLRDLLDLVDRFERRQVGMRSVSEMLDTASPMGRFTVSLLGAMAQWERETIAERVKMGIRHRRSQNGYVGGPAPAGTVVVGAAGKRVLQVVPEWKAVAVHAWEMAADGRTLTEIAAYLDDKGLRPRTTGDESRSVGSWHKPTLHKWLTNRNLVGLLIDQDTFTRAVAMIQARGCPMHAGKRVSVSDRVWPLKGLAKCWHCGGALVGLSAYGRNKTAHYYLRCSVRQKSKASCAAPDLPAVEIERMVVDTVLDAVRDNGKEIVEQLAHSQAKALAQSSDTAEKIAQLTLERDGLKQQVRRLVDMVAKGGLAGDACQERLAELQTDHVRISHQVAELEGIQAAVMMSRMNAEVVVDQIRQGVENMLGAAPEDVARSLAILVKDVRVSKDDIEVALYGDTAVGSYGQKSRRSVVDRIRTIVTVRRQLSVSRKGRGNQWVVGMVPVSAASVV